MEKNGTKPIRSLSKQIYWGHSAGLFIEAAQEEAIEFIKEHSGENPKDLEPSIIDVLPEKFKASNDVTEENSITYEKLKLASEMMWIIRHVKLCFEELPKPDLAWLMIILGSDRQQLITKYDDVAKLLKERIRTTGKEGRKRGWADHKKIMKDATEVAESMWSGGGGEICNFPLNEMIEYLLTGPFIGTIKLRYRAELKRHLKPIAEKYGHHRKRAPRKKNP